MDGTDQAASTIWYVLAIILVGSALIGRQMAWGSLLRMALLWVAIFAGLLGLFKFGQSQGFLTGRWAEEGSAVTPDEAPAALPRAQAEGQALRIPVAPDGHYWVEATINGTPARFLIDSGATITALSENTARAAGLNYDVGEPNVIMTTANGKVEAKRSSIATLAIGPISASDLPVVVSPAFGEVNVIGMNMLSRLKSWGVQDGAMVLKP
ncbi:MULTISPECIES: retropepsin-like aspartic protease family protein [Sphingobium]|jgi:aspartyl protease family protein|uniref:retropepsin-like aspartic protease family protein n=1 Tax=Sphingobium TaxID=165695 RepID=UPI000DBB7168|nr:MULTISPECIES: TIGR02281 family clan AA aspartic protease [Sphingobium]KAA9018384.1 TIGR02281 family clan AA aspartic protease [Sphingobium limneticum]MBU0931119.1 TIGR02281 family clan AA aspartic protease [Alphaproteobacteria bacterium]BBC99886.1 aspartyl protease family protein [Sphingobium sp. YG1]